MKYKLLSPTMMLLMISIATMHTTSATQPTDDSGGVIAFGSDRDGDEEIYVVNANGSDLIQLTNNDDMEAYPAWSPDGTQLVFGSDRDGNFELYIMNADGSDQQRLTNTSQNEYMPDWSPDGTQIVFGPDDQNIYVIDVDGGNRQQLTFGEGRNWWPTWSPDSTQIAFCSDRDGDMDIYIMDANGDNVRNVTNNDADDMKPDWSPDGTQILFASTLAGNDDIYAIDIDGDNLQQLTTSRAEDWNPAWSVDGTHIAFVSYRSGRMGIHVMDIRNGPENDGGKVFLLTNEREHNELPAWKPIPTEATSQPVTTPISSETYDQIAPLHIFDEHGAPVIAVDVASDGQLMASADGGGTIKLWDLNSREVLRSFQAHNSYILALTFSPTERSWYHQAEIAQPRFGMSKAVR